MKTLQRYGLWIDPVHLIYATQPGVSLHTRVQYMCDSKVGVPNSWLH